MMPMRRNKTLISVLLLVLTINIYLMYKTINNKGSPLDNLTLKEITRVIFLQCYKKYRVFKEYLKVIEKYSLNIDKLNHVKK